MKLKKIFFSICFLLFSSSVFAEDNFEAFSFLGKMPVLELNCMNKIQFSYSPVESENSAVPFVSYLLTSFLLNSSFENDCWNQNQFTKDFFYNNVEVKF